MVKGSKTFYTYLIAFGTILAPLLLLALRGYFGYSFYVAGSGKLANIARTADFFETLNIPFPTAQAYLVGAVEMVGGILLLIGLAARLAGLVLSVVMITAYLTAHFPAVQNIVTDFTAFTQESPFLFLLISLLVLAFGPGAISIDALLKRYLFKVSS